MSLPTRFNQSCHLLYSFRWFPRGFFPSIIASVQQCVTGYEISFLSLIMAMIHIARLTFYLLLAKLYLATKSQQPIDYDYKNALRVLVSYLKKLESLFTVKIWNFILFMFWSHHEGNSHTELILWMSTSYFGCISGKQRVGSPSSTEAEIIATWLADVLKNLI